MVLIIKGGVLPLIIFSCGFFSIIIGLAQCSIRKKDTINYFSALSHFSFGFFLMTEMIYTFFEGTSMGFLFFLSQSLLTICLVSIYFYFRSLFFRGAISVYRVYKIGVLIIIIILFCFVNFIYNVCGGKFFSKNWVADFFFREDIVRFVVYLWGIFCFAKASWDFKFLQKPRSDKTISLNKILHGFLILSAFILIIVVVLFMLRNSFFIFFYEITLLYYSFFIISMVIFSYRHPDFFNIARNEASRLRYLQSKINGIDVKEVVERLKDIMENEKLYLKNDLSLTKLSELLDLTPHQLSEILNKEMNLNFNIFINRYRIEEAKRILITDKYQTILHIALNSGFNSKTAFNKSFHSAVGLTPKEYRYLHGQDAMQTF